MVILLELEGPDNDHRTAIANLMKMKKLTTRLGGQAF